jgi:hypothetical protein
MSTMIEPTTNNVEMIQQGFATAGVVATTSLHGALFALLHGCPPIAIDQVEGGSKVSAVLGRIRWPLVFRADEVDAATIEKAFARARNSQRSEFGIIAGSEATMANLAGESNDGVLRLDFDRRLIL